MNDIDRTSAGCFRHIVMIKFREEADEERIVEVERAFARLKDRIETIREFEWGPSESIEGRNDGFTHCFLVSFEDPAGLEFYLPHPAHMEFKDLLGPVMEKVLVYDYTARKC